MHPTCALRICRAEWSAASLPRRRFNPVHPLGCLSVQPLSPGLGGVFPCRHSFRRSVIHWAHSELFPWLPCSRSVETRSFMSASFALPDRVGFSHVAPALRLWLPMSRCRCRRTANRLPERITRPSSLAGAIPARPSEPSTQTSELQGNTVKEKR